MKNKEKELDLLGGKVRRRQVGGEFPCLQKGKRTWESSPTGSDLLTKEKRGGGESSHQERGRDEPAGRTEKGGAITTSLREGGKERSLGDFIIA